MPGVGSVAKSEIRGLKEFRRELRKMDKALPVEMRKVHRKVADLVSSRTRTAMAGGLQSGRAAKGIKPSATSRSALIDTATTARSPFTLAVIWGQRKRSGWYAAPRYADSKGKQFEPWVGNQWDPGEHGGRPYYLGFVVDESLDEIDRIYLEGVDELARRAFPD